MIVKTFRWADEAATSAFATRLAQHWLQQPASANMVILLHGDLGAGKTTLVRRLLRGLGVTGRIKSPTYAVVEPYVTPCVQVWHFDFYRFGDPREWEDAGLRDIFATPGLKLVEWPDKAAGMLPQADWVLHLQTLDDDVREVVIEAPTAAGAALLQEVS